LESRSRDSEGCKGRFNDSSCKYRDGDESRILHHPGRKDIKPFRALGQQMRSRAASVVRRKFLCSGIRGTATEQGVATPCSSGVAALSDMRYKKYL